MNWFNESKRSCKLILEPLLILASHHNRLSQRGWVLCFLVVMRRHIRDLSICVERLGSTIFTTLILRQTTNFPMLFIHHSATHPLAVYSPVICHRQFTWRWIQLRQVAVETAPALDETKTPGCCTNRHFTRATKGVDCSCCGCWVLSAVFFVTCWHWNGSAGALGVHFWFENLAKLVPKPS